MPLAWQKAVKSNHNSIVFKTSKKTGVIIVTEEMVMKPGKHQRSKHRGQYLWWKNHDHASFFTMHPYTMHELCTLICIFQVLSFKTTTLWQAMIWPSMFQIPYLPRSIWFSPLPFLWQWVISRAFHIQYFPRYHKVFKYVKSCHYCNRPQPSAWHLLVTNLDIFILVW